jgi:ribosomal protein S18 acetylase RimI-like enzyme
MTVRVRAYAGPADLRSIQDLTQRIWTPASPQHVGDLAWGRLRYTPEVTDWPIALWEEAGRVVAWGSARLPDDLQLDVDPAHPELMDEVLAWFDGQAGDGLLEINPLDNQTDLRQALVRHGYEERAGTAYFAYHARSLLGLPKPTLPQGFTARAVRGPDDLPERVAVHQRAWGSTNVTEESFRAMMAAWPYRSELDWVIEAADGRFVANCHIWYDDGNRIGLIEPVGTVPELRRRGLSRAVCLAALHALREQGGALAIVSPRGDAAYPIPQTLYRTIGFRQYARTVSYAKNGHGSSAPPTHGGEDVTAAPSEVERDR